MVAHPVKPAPRVKFRQQLEAVKNAATKNLIAIGDFNIDTGKQNDPAASTIISGMRLMYLPDWDVG